MNLMVFWCFPYLLELSVDNYGFVDFGMYLNSDFTFLSIQHMFLNWERETRKSPGAVCECFPWWCSGSKADLRWQALRNFPHSLVEPRSVAQEAVREIARAPRKFETGIFSIFIEDSRQTQWLVTFTVTSEDVIRGFPCLLYMCLNCRTLQAAGSVYLYFGGSSFLSCTRWSVSVSVSSSVGFSSPDSGLPITVQLYSKITDRTQTKLRVVISSESRLNL